MKKMLMALLALFLSGSMLVVPAFGQTQIAGKYSLACMEIAGFKIDGDHLAEAGLANFYIEFLDNGKCQLGISGDEQKEGMFALDGNMLTIIDSANDKNLLSINGNQIIIEDKDKGIKMVFQKQ